MQTVEKIDLLRAVDLSPVIKRIGESPGIDLVHDLLKVGPIPPVQVTCDLEPNVL